MARKNKVMVAGAREGKVKPDDIEGSTFTVSNLGAYGVETLHRHHQSARSGHSGRRREQSHPGCDMTKVN